MARARTGASSTLILSFILVLSWSRTAAHGEGGGEGRVVAQCDIKNCTSVQSVPCKNGTVTFGLEQCITEKHGDCEVGVYDKLCGAFLNVSETVDLSRLLKHQNVTLNFCPEFCLKLQCLDKKNNLVFCFRVVNDPQSRSSDGAYEPWVYVPIALVVILVAVVVIVLLYCCVCKSQKHKDQSVKFSEVKQVEQV
ncbi:hypothetical protein MHYP_G00031800 [Metynnis hypsauchen]